jgi:murein L,D-transpeptidase YafK
MNRLLFIIIFSAIISFAASAQNSFVDFQKGFMRVAYALKTKEDTLRKQFTAAGLTWPAKEIYLRSFKYDSQLEVWVRNNSNEPFKLFKTYKVCAMAGAIGPKRMQDDYQVPEGFYYINQFNPNSNYHLALGINYPNESDKVLSDSLRPGSGIYIHGSCITVGCIPLQDGPIEEVYLLAAVAKSEGEDFIPVHIFPVGFNREKSMEYLSRITKDDQSLQKFEIKMKEVYDYFEENKKLPFIAVNKKGDYIIM